MIIAKIHQLFDEPSIPKKYERTEGFQVPSIFNTGPILNQDPLVYNEKFEGHSQERIQDKRKIHLMSFIISF